MAISDMPERMDQSGHCKGAWLDLNRMNDG